MMENALPFASELLCFSSLPVVEKRGRRWNSGLCGQAHYAGLKMKAIRMTPTIAIYACARFRLQAALAAFSRWR